MKQLDRYISESKQYKFKNTELLSCFLNIKENKNHKKLGILYIKVTWDTEDSVSFELCTKNAVWNIFVEEDLDNIYQISGNLAESAYDEVDELVWDTLRNQNAFPFGFETKSEWSNEEIFEETISRLDEDTVRSAFKKMSNLKETIEKAVKEAEDYGYADCIKELIYQLSDYK